MILNAVKMKVYSIFPTPRDARKIDPGPKKVNMCLAVLSSHRSARLAEDSPPVEAPRESTNDV